MFITFLVLRLLKEYYFLSEENNQSLFFTYLAYEPKKKKTNLNAYRDIPDLLALICINDLFPESFILIARIHCPLGKSLGNITYFTFHFIHIFV
jgi:hypothetical protein